MLQLPGDRNRMKQTNGEGVDGSESGNKLMPCTIRARGVYTIRGHGRHHQGFPSVLIVFAILEGGVVFG